MKLWNITLFQVVMFLCAISGILFFADKNHVFDDIKNYFKKPVYTQPNLGVPKSFEKFMKKPPTQ